MPEAVSPTRMNLLQRKQQAKIAVQGVDLLKRKRDALVADFFNIVRQSLAARESLTKACEEAYVMLALAKAWEGREALEAAASRSRAARLCRTRLKKSATSASRFRLRSSMPCCAIRRWVRRCSRFIRVGLTTSDTRSPPRPPSQSPSVLSRPAAAGGTSPPAYD